MNEQNDGAQLPIRAGLRWFEVFSPTHAHPIDAVLLADRFFGQWTHYVDKRVIPCPQNENCLFCRNGTAPRWTGYIAALRNKPRKEIVISLSEGAARQLLAMKNEHGRLRGLQCTFVRRQVTDKSGKLRVNAPVDVKLFAVVKGEGLPPAFDIHDSLSRLWGIHQEWLRRQSARDDHQLPDTGRIIRLPAYDPSEVPLE